MMWFGPTAPALSGVNALPSPNKPRKLAEAGGEDVGENPLAENELVATRLTDASDMVFSVELEVELVDVSLAELLVVAERSGLDALCEGF